MWFSDSNFSFTGGNINIGSIFGALLRYLKNKSYLGCFWISIVKKYRMRRLSNEQIEWIIKAKVNGKFTNKEIADMHGISISRVQQLYREYKSAGVIHVQKKLGDIKGLFPRKLKMKSLSYTENTELTQAISAGYYLRKNCTSEMKRSIKYSRKDLQ